MGKGTQRTNEEIAMLLALVRAGADLVATQADLQDRMDDIESAAAKGEMADTAEIRALIRGQHERLTNTTIMMARSSLMFARSLVSDEAVRKDIDTMASAPFEEFAEQATLCVRNLNAMGALLDAVDGIPAADEGPGAKGDQARA